MKRFSLLTMMILVANGASADEEDLLSVFGDEELISIATGYKKPISKAPAVASVITAEEIKKLGATDLDQVLETVPGLHVSVNPLGYSPIYSFRGVVSDFNAQVLMLVNGIPITNVYLGNRNLVWGGMPVEAVSRIEIIRGPGSAVYGSDAFAGVINVITKGGTDIDGMRAGFRYGSFDTVQAWSQIGGQSGELTYAVSLEYENTDGQNSLVQADAQSALDFLTGTNASLAPGSVNAGRESYEVRLDLALGRWRLQSGMQQREIQSGAGAAQALDPSSLSVSNRFNTSISYINDKVANGDWTLSAAGSYLSTSQELDGNLVLFPAGSTGPNFDPVTRLPIFVDGNGQIRTYPDGMIGNPEVFEKHYRLDVSGLYRGFQGHEIRLGAGYHLGDMYRVKETKNFGVDPDDPFSGDPSNPFNLLLPGSPIIDVTDTPFAFITEGDRSNYYLFVQDAWRFANDWELTAGVRYDDYSDFGSTVNPRVALVWSTSQNLTTKLLFGEAFRAPSFAETRNRNNPSLLGNSDLNPEEMKSYELAFDYRPMHNVHLNMNLFYYQWDDIILFAPDSGGTTRTAQNAGEQVGHGFEFEGRWEATETLDFYGNFAYVDTTDKRTNTAGGNAPEKQLYLRSDWALYKNWSWDLQANWVMDRQRTYMDSRSNIDDYLWVDSTLRFQPEGEVWELALIVKNLLDDDAFESSPSGVPMAPIPNDLPLAGRSIFGEVRVRF